MVCSMLVSMCDLKALRHACDDIIALAEKLALDIIVKESALDCSLYSWFM